MRYLRLIGLFIVALIPGLAYFAGRRSSQKEQELKDANSYIDTRQAIDFVLPESDVDRARERLRERGRNLR